MLKNVVFLAWICGTLLVTSVGLGIYAIQQSLRIADLTTELVGSVAELSKAKANHKKQLAKQKSKLKAQARIRRGLIAVLPFVGASVAVYFEEQDYQEWLQDNPEGNRQTYLCEVATYSAEIVDELVDDTLQALPSYLGLNPDNIKSRIEVPKCSEA